MPRSASPTRSGSPGAKLVSEVLDDPATFRTAPGLKKAPPPVAPKPNRLRPFNDTDKANLRSYTNGGFMQINPYLRNPEGTGKPFRKRFQDKADGVSDAMSKLPSEPGRTYRGANLRNKPGVLDKYREGEIVREDAFTSTSKNPNIHGSGQFAGDTRFTINGRNGKNVTEYSDHDEEEILFDKGTDFKVDKVTNNGRFTDIEMTEV